MLVNQHSSLPLPFPILIPLGFRVRGKWGKAKNQKEPPQFAAQAFTGVQVFVESLNAIDKQTKVSSLPLPELRTKLNEQILKGTYETPIGEISFDPEGEVKQKQFFVAQIKMNPDGKDGKFVFLK